MGKTLLRWPAVIIGASLAWAGGFLPAGEDAAPPSPATPPANGAPGPDAAKGDGPKPGDAKVDATPTPAAPTRWVVTLDDGGEITGTIVKKTPALWTILTDAKVSLEINRDRIRAVKPAEAVPAPATDAPSPPKPPAPNGGPGGPAAMTPPPPPVPGGGPRGGPGGPGGPGIVPPGGMPMHPPGENSPPPGGPGGDKPHPHLTLHLKNGDSITGTIEKVDGNSVWIRKDPKSDPIEIKKDQIKGEERAP